jgi:TP901-1 family phage major tail protein
MGNELGGKSIRIDFGMNNAGTAVTFADSGDTVTQTAHGYSAGQIVSFATIVTTTGITVDTNYFVKAPTANTYQLSLTNGGAAIALTTDGTGTLNEVYQTVGGIRSKSISINSEAIDITNQDSSEWRKILDSAGIRTVSLSGSGVFEDGSVINAIRSAMMSNALRNCRFFMTSDLDYFEGSFKITTFELSGEYNAESSYSASFESSGDVTYNSF